MKLNSSPKVSVIIPTFNRAEMVCRCVGSVLASNWKDLEVIVVDDCSPDDTGKRVGEMFGGDARVRYFRNDGNSFQAVSRNRGAAVATGDFLLFLDDDNVVDSNMIPELVACFGRHCEAGLIAPMSIHRRPGKDGLIWTLGSDFNRWTSQPKDFLPNIPVAEVPDDKEDFTTTYSPNAFMVKADVFSAIGGFEESFVQIFEESDFGWRIIEAGHECWITTKATTEHLGFLEPGCVPELRQLGIEKPFRTYCFARNRLRFVRRHFSLPQILSVTLLFAPLSAVYYGMVAMKNRRPDIAWAYAKGTLRGIFGLK